jgi:hypothetical protein
MSTMYEALRKAEAERKKAAGVVENSSVSEGVPVSLDTSEGIKIAALIAAIVVVFAIAFFRFNAAKGRMAPNRPAVAAVTEAAVVPLALAKGVRAPGTYGLDGVIDAGANSMAIINGKLLKVDGQIEHMILKKISPKEVEMLNTQDNTTLILKIN